MKTKLFLLLSIAHALNTNLLRGLSPTISGGSALTASVGQDFATANLSDENLLQSQNENDICIVNPTTDSVTLKYNIGNNDVNSVVVINRQDTSPSAPGGFQASVGRVLKAGKRAASMKNCISSFPRSGSFQCE